MVSLTSILMLLCIPSKAQQNNMDSLLRRLEEFSKETGVKVERIEKGHDYVDLGLSVKWATCNVGADKPQDFGDLYAWGEIEPRLERSIENYKYCEGDNHSFTKYCTDKKYGYRRFTDKKTTLDPEDDVAHVKWGSDWRMPTNEEFQELKDNCTWEWDSIDGVRGIRFTSNVPGYTDRSVFLPAAGGDGILINGADSKSGNTYYFGNYWSSTLDKDSPDLAKGAFFIKAELRLYSPFSLVVSRTYRDARRSVRPVCPSDSKVSLTGLSADMIAKVKAYTPDPGELEEYEYIIEIKPTLDDVNTDSKDNKLFQVPEGITLKELLARLPGVEKDKDCSFITESGKDIVTSIEFNGGKVYPENTTSGYPDDYKLNSGAIHVVIMDRKHFREYMSKTDRDGLPKNRAEISISHYPRQNADDLLYVLLRGRREK